MYGGDIVSREESLSSMYKPLSHTQMKFSNSKIVDEGNMAMKRKNQLSYLTKVSTKNKQYLESKWNEGRKNKFSGASKYGFN